MSQFGADIFDDDSKPPAEPPTAGEPPKKRPRKPARKKAATASEPEAEPQSSVQPGTDAGAGSEPSTPEAEPKKGRKKPAARRGKAPAEDSAREVTAPEAAAREVPVAPSERVHTDLGDVLFPARRPTAKTERDDAPTPKPVQGEPPARERKDPRPRDREAARATEPAPIVDREPLAEPADHEGGPPRERPDDDDGRRRGRRRGRRGRRGERDDDRSTDAGFAPAEAEREARGDVESTTNPPIADADDTSEGGSIPTHDAEIDSAAPPQQDPFARRSDAPRPGRGNDPSRDRHRDGPRREGSQQAHSQRGPHGRDDRRHGPRDERRDDRRFERRRDEFEPDDAPPPRLPRRDLTNARRAPALPTPALPRRAAVLVDVAALMQQARDCGGELSFRRLQKALLGHDELVLGLAFVTPDVPPTGRGALAAAGFSLRECADAAAASSAMQAATSEVPADAERVVLAGLARDHAGTAPAAERAGFRSAVDGDRGDLLLGTDCMFVP